MASQRQPPRTHLRRGAELKRAGEQPAPASEPRKVASRARRVPQHSQEPRRAGFTLRSLDIARLDRFVTQAQRIALRAEREFDGVTIQLDVDGGISVNAVGMTSMRL